MRCRKILGAAGENRNHRLGPDPAGTKRPSSIRRMRSASERRAGRWVITPARHPSRDPRERTTRAISTTGVLHERSRVRTAPGNSRMAETPCPIAKPHGSSSPAASASFAAAGRPNPAGGAHPARLRDTRFHCVHRSARLDGMPAQNFSVLSAAVSAQRHSQQDAATTPQGMLFGICSRGVSRSPAVASNETTAWLKQPPLERALTQPRKKKGQFLPCSGNSIRQCAEAVKNLFN